MNPIQTTKSRANDTFLPIRSATFRSTGITLATARKNDSAKNPAIIRKIAYPTASGSSRIKKNVTAPSETFHYCVSISAPTKATNALLNSHSSLYSALVIVIAHLPLAYDLSIHDGPRYTSKPTSSSGWLSIG